VESGPKAGLNGKREVFVSVLAPLGSSLRIYLAEIWGFAGLRPTSGGSIASSEEYTNYGKKDLIQTEAYPGVWVRGSNRAKTYGKAHCEGETFPITRLFGKVCARSHQHVKDFYRVSPGEPYIIFGKVPDNIPVSV